MNKSLKYSAIAKFDFSNGWNYFNNSVMSENGRFCWNVWSVIKVFHLCWYDRILIRLVSSCFENKRYGTTASLLEVRQLLDRDVWVLRTPADANSTARAVPPVHLQRFAGDKLYEMEDMHVGFWLLDQTILISYEFSANCVVLFCMTLKVVWKGCPFISFETVNFLHKIDRWNETTDITAC